MEEVSSSASRCFKSVAQHAEGVENLRRLNLILDDYMADELKDNKHYDSASHSLSVATASPPNARKAPDSSPQSPLTESTLERLTETAKAEALVRVEATEAAKKVQIKARELAATDMGQERYKVVCQELEELKQEAQEKQRLVDLGTKERVESEKALLILRILSHYGDKLDDEGMAKIGAKLSLKEYGEWTDLSEADRLLQEKKKEMAAAHGAAQADSRSN